MIVPVLILTLPTPIFTIRDAAASRRQIRYLACEVTAPGVLDGSRSGQRYGRSPDTLLRLGID